ncbi:molybdopterin-containing oxidoreductase family protein [Microvirga thermotolerans]|uniref:Molybdopterin-dependent oxidoreductase n=1 Tax=Microvirga thermotolerans TaxID=2651334 RepID=A0A5P9JWY9_9HYPH|nr:molybdopterin oxidoreductase family protein [Microvirga thermotolerans]QFU16258.1 molybdopterin-dependent oxidoreductase [Microvirga thermotolerans]
MNQSPRIERRPSVCPHDCPSTCSLDVEVIDGRSIGRVHGARSNSYTAGVICAKVARYAERIHHPERLLYPMQRTGPKGSGQFERISWDEALDAVAEAFLRAEAGFGPQSVWPYYYAGTMGYVMRDGINRLRNVKRYSGQYSTICTATAYTGFVAGTGRLAGPDPREMAKADCVVIWGTNAVHTQVNVMTHALRARKERGAKIVAIDIYMNATMKQADMALLVKPGTDGALACAVMHVLFRDGYADRAYLARYTDRPEEFEAHLQSRDPHWAAAITGLSVEEIEAFAQLVGERRRTYFRLGFGFARQRNGTVNMHAASCIPAVTGAWQYEGGGAFHSNGAIYRWNKTMIEALDVADTTVRRLDQSQIGRVLTGDAEALFHGPPVKAMLIQNTNPVSVAPEQELVKKGFAREDLFVCVHEQFMTETALMADIVLPATMFMEHDDLYSAGGHQHFQLGPKLVEPPGECRSNHEVIRAIARRVGASHPGFEMEPRELIDWTLRHSGWGSIEDLEREVHRDVQPAFREAHYLDGFAYPDGRFRFKPDWTRIPSGNNGPMGPWTALPAFPDHWPVTEEATGEHPFRLATSPARNFLNSSFNETPTSRAKEGRPEVMIHPLDAAPFAIADGDWVVLRNRRGEVYLRARLFDGVRRGVLIAEGIWPNAAHPYGRGINTLTGADQVAPYGGAAFHDNRVALAKAEPGRGFPLPEAGAAEAEPAVV